VVIEHGHRATNDSIHVPARAFRLARVEHEYQVRAAYGRVGPTLGVVNDDAGVD
jgi:hypothetical protein